MNRFTKFPRLALTLTALLVLGLALVACGDDTATSGAAGAVAGATPAGSAASSGSKVTTAAATFGPAPLTPPPVTGTPTKTGTGLQYLDIKVGTGAEAKTGQQVSVHYAGWLTSNGKKFDSSLDRGQPFQFQIGGRVIQGWNEGVVGMKVGGKRRLLIPPALGYGSSGSPPVIPPNADLTFDVDLLGIG